MWKKYSSAIQCQWSNDYECRLADDVKLSATWEATHVDGEAWIPDLHSSFFLLCYFSSCLVCFCDVICIMLHASLFAVLHSLVLFYIEDNANFKCGVGFI